MTPSHGNAARIGEGQNRPYAVGPVVTAKASQRRSRVIPRFDFRREQDFPTGATQAQAELEVLTALQFLIEQAHAIKNLPPPAAAEYCVYPPGRAGSGAEVRISHPERVGQHNANG